MNSTAPPEYPGELELHCLCCYRPLKEAPTELGWVKQSRTKGVCFDCIESLHRTMVAHRAMDTPIPGMTERGRAQPINQKP